MQQEQPDKRNKWIVLTLVTAMLLPFVFGGCSRPSDEREQEKPVTPTQIEIRVGIARTLLSTPVIIASELKLLEQHGLRPALTIYHSGKAALHAMFNGEVDVATTATTPVVFASFKRKDFKVLATIVSSYRDSKLLARRDSGVETIQALRGKRMGVHTGTSGQLFLHGLLAEHGLKASDVVQKTIISPRLPDALAEGTVDAIAVWEPHAYLTKQKLGDEVVELPTGESFRTTFNLAVKNDFLDGHRREMTALLRTIKEADTFIEREPIRSKRILAARLELKPDLVDALWDEYRFELSLDQSLIIALESRAQWFIEQGLIEGNETPNYLEFIDTKLMQVVSPTAMQVIE